MPVEEPKNVSTHYASVLISLHKISESKIGNIVDIANLLYATTDKTLDDEANAIISTINFKEIWDKVTTNEHNPFTIAVRHMLEYEIYGKSSNFFGDINRIFDFLAENNINSSDINKAENYCKLYDLTYDKAELIPNAMKLFTLLLKHDNPCELQKMQKTNKHGLHRADYIIFMASKLKDIPKQNVVKCMEELEEKKVPYNKILYRGLYKTKEELKDEVSTQVELIKRPNDNFTDFFKALEPPEDKFMANRNNRKNILDKISEQIAIDNPPLLNGDIQNIKDSLTEEIKDLLGKNIKNLLEYFSNNLGAQNFNIHSVNDFNIRSVNETLYTDDNMLQTEYNLLRLAYITMDRKKDEILSPIKDIDLSMCSPGSNQDIAKCINEIVASTTKDVMFSVKRKLITEMILEALKDQKGDIIIPAVFFPSLGINPGIEKHMISGLIDLIREEYKLPQEEFDPFSPFYTGDDPNRMETLERLKNLVPLLVAKIDIQLSNPCVSGEFWRQVAESMITQSGLYNSKTSVDIYNSLSNLEQNFGVNIPSNVKFQVCIFGDDGVQLDAKLDYGHILSKYICTILFPSIMERLSEVQSIKQYGLNPKLSNFKEESEKAQEQCENDIDTVRNQYKTLKETLKKFDYYSFLHRIMPGVDEVLSDCLVKKSKQWTYLKVYDAKENKTDKSKVQEYYKLCYQKDNYTSKMLNIRESL